jgi:surface antigen
MRSRSVVLAVAVATASIAAALTLAQLRSAAANPAPCAACPALDEAPGLSPRSRAAGHGPELDDTDEIAALDAIRVALSEVGDGVSYVWHRNNGRLSGVIHPTTSFKDAAGRVCRHIVLVLTTGLRSGRIEGVACRLGDGRWQLEG